MMARPTYLDHLADFERERQGEILRTLELHLAEHRFDQAHRTLSAFELEVSERQLPLERMGLSAVAVRSLNRAGIETGQQLRDATDSELDALVAGLETIRSIKAARQRMLEA
jgi:hypothetical protein